jgi:hypothetical protein
MVLLPSLTKHTHSRIKKGRNSPLTTTSMTFLVLVYDLDSFNSHYVSFFDVVLESPAVGEGSMAVHCPPGRQVFSCGPISALKVQNDCVRIITKYPCWVCTLYLTEGSRIIKGTSLPIENDQEPEVMGGDCLRGKMCGRDGWFSVKIHDYLRVP